MASGKQKAPRAETMLAMYREMVRIRAFEERVRNLAAAGRAPGLVHLYSGQEAVGVGVISALQPGDWIASHHRGHGHCLAKGADMTRVLAEILGRRTGYGLGRGGSMHVIDAEHNNLGCNGIVGGGVPLATGAALTAKLRGTGAVSVAFFGDGALNQGIVFECFNMASIWSLPVIFVCENNRYGEFTAIDDVTAGTSLLDRGKTFSIPTVDVDGMDALAVYDAASTAAARARKGGGPSMMVCETYRFGGHHVGDSQDYRAEEERCDWERKDPIPRLRRRLMRAKGAGGDALDAIEREAAEDVERSVRAAQAAAPPDEADFAVHVHAG